ncbi:MAG TPA: SIS domain-containing protein [Candidatus Paceibacterota bacterium]|nr:SIS domain-containing protein [Candidatus Paceibacterota bacterium]
MIEQSIRARYREFLSISDFQIGLIRSLAEEISQAFILGHRVYAFGNGGSASQAQHFTTELIGRFKGNRRSLPAISLCTDTSAMTAISNDFGFDHVFSRQVESLVEAGDVVIGFTTSGTSPNVLAGLAEAKKHGGITVLISGDKGQIAPGASDIVIEVGGQETAIIQEAHLILIHIVCELIESKMGLSENELERVVPRFVHESHLSEIQLPPHEAIVWVNGCFDLLHEGHLRLLNQASKMGKYLVVGINSDESVRRIKGASRPYVSEENRARTLLQFPFVDLVVIFAEDDPLTVLKHLRPGKVIKGPEYRERDYPEKSFLTEIGCTVSYTDEVQGVSTTRIVDRIMTNGNS